MFILGSAHLVNTTGSRRESFDTQQMLHWYRLTYTDYGFRDHGVYKYFHLEVNPGHLLDRSTRKKYYGTLTRLPWRSTSK